MKRKIMILILAAVVLTSCNNFNNEDPVAVYDDHLIYDYQINEFVKMKTKLIEIYYNNLDEIDYTNPSIDEITEMDYLNYMEFCQLSFAEKTISEYLDFTDEEKRVDYFVSMERYNYFYTELQESDFVEQIYEYNKQQISDNIETMYCGAEILTAIEALANECDMSVSKYIDEVYLDVAIDLSLQDYKSDIFINNYFEGEVYQDIEGDVFLSLSTTNYSSQKLQEFWNITENYYSFLYEYNSQFYSFLKEKALSKVAFY